MKIFVKAVSTKDNCLSLNDLQKCYRKKYVKVNNKNDCEYCIDRTSSSDPILECKDKNYCDMNLNRRDELIVKKSNIDNIIKWIFSLLGLFTGVCLTLDLLYKMRIFQPTNVINKFVVNNFLGHNFTNVIKYIIIITILILFLKILYTSLTDNKIETTETDELIYDDDAHEFDEYQ